MASLKEKTTYSRKISAEEVKGRYLFLSRDIAKALPKPTIPFELQFNNESIQTSVQIVDCWCMGPKKPHIHHHLDLKGLFKKTQIRRKTTVQLIITEEGEYKVSI